MRSFDLKLMIEEYKEFSPRGAMQRRLHSTGCFSLFGFRLSAFGFRRLAFGFSALQLFGFPAFREADGKSLPVSAVTV
jgi:hypothetical protein